MTREVVRTPIPALFSVIVLALMLAGCATSVGPIGTIAFDGAVRSALGPAAGPVLLLNRIEWCPGEDAYTLRQPEEIRPGILVLQESRLVVLEWDQDGQSYRTGLTIVYSDAKDVRRRVWGVNQRIVVETREGVTQAFTLTTDNGAAVSIPQTNKAIALLRTKIPSSDAATDLAGR